MCVLSSSLNTSSTLLSAVFFTVFHSSVVHAACPHLAVGFGGAFRVLTPIESDISRAEASTSKQCHTLTSREQ